MQMMEELNLKDQKIVELCDAIRDQDGKMAENNEKLFQKMKHLATNVELNALRNSLQDYATKLNQDEFEERVRPLIDFCKETLVIYQ